MDAQPPFACFYFFFYFLIRTSVRVAWRGRGGVHDAAWPWGRTTDNGHGQRHDTGLRSACFFPVSRRVPRKLVNE